MSPGWSCRSRSVQQPTQSKTHQSIGDGSEEPSSGVPVSKRALQLRRTLLRLILPHEVPLVKDLESESRSKITIQNRALYGYLSELKENLEGISFMEEDGCQQCVLSMVARGGWQLAHCGHTWLNWDWLHFSFQPVVPWAATREGEDGNLACWAIVWDGLQIPTICNTQFWPLFHVDGRLVLVLVPIKNGWSCRAHAAYIKHTTVPNRNCTSSNICIISIAPDWFDVLVNEAAEGGGLTALIRSSSLDKKTTAWPEYINGALWCSARGICGADRLFGHRWPCH